MEEEIKMITRMSSLMRHREKIDLYCDILKILKTSKDLDEATMRIVTLCENEDFYKFRDEL